MIESIYLEIIILLLMVWMFGSKLLPQTIIIFLTIVMMINQVGVVENLKYAIGTIILYACIIMYSALNVHYGKDENGEN